MLDEFIHIPSGCLKSICPSSRLDSFSEIHYGCCKIVERRRVGNERTIKTILQKKAKVVRDSNEHLLGGAYFRVEKKL